MCLLLDRILVSVYLFSSVEIRTDWLSPQTGGSHGGLLASVLSEWHADEP